MTTADIALFFLCVYLVWAALRAFRTGQRILRNERWNWYFGLRKLRGRFTRVYGVAHLITGMLYLVAVGLTLARVALGNSGFTPVLIGLGLSLLVNLGAVLVAEIMALD
ncbi:MAG: hypothetical protein HC915_08525 [Anaerolineae bacterium]|nr:hypothetical protein [Anaerolineae bacterium]